MPFGDSYKVCLANIKVSGIYKMKNHHKIMKMLSILALLMFIPMISALSPPIQDTFSISSPVAPGDGIIGECTPWEIAGEYCNGDVRHYEQCIKTVAGGEWQHQSEVCTDYADDVRCLAGKCVKQSDVFLSVAIGLFLIVLSIFLINKLRKRR